MANAFAFAESRDGSLRKVAFEAVTAARQAADASGGGEVHALVVGGPGIAAKAEELVQYVFKRIISLVGCVTGGSGRRCQTFITKDFKLQDIRETCHEIRNVVKKLGRDKGRNGEIDTIKEMKKTTNITINGLAKRCTNFGTLSATHMVHPLCFLKLAPMYLLSFAVVSPTANQFKKEQMSCSMRLYLVHYAKS
jgi:hypothetical protein